LGATAILISPAYPPIAKCVLKCELMAKMVKVRNESSDNWGMAAFHSGELNGDIV
jgi:hypothetical protein